MVVFEDAEIQLLFSPGSSDYLWITFGDMLLMADGKRFYAAPVATRKSINTLGIMPKKRHWYPPESFRAARQAVAGILADFPTRVLYGGSMGGYGALKSSALFDATVVIAFCPQWSIAPGEVGRADMRYQHHYTGAGGHAVLKAEVSGRLYIFYDPGYELDTFHARHLTLLPGARAITLPNVGHNLTPVLAGADRLDSIIQACRNDDVRVIGKITSEARRKSNIRIASVLSRAFFGRPKTTQKIMENVRKDRTPKDLSELYSTIAANLRRDRRNTEARSMYEKAVAENNRNIGAMLGLCYLDILAHRYDSAVAWAERALPLAPDSPASIKALEDACKARDKEGRLF